MLGKALQFQVQIGFNASDYYFEKCKFVSGLGRGQSAPEFDDALLHMIQFNQENAESDLKQTGGPVKKTMKDAVNYGGSKLKDGPASRASLRLKRLRKKVKLFTSKQ